MRILAAAASRGVSEHHIPRTCTHAHTHTHQIGSVADQTGSGRKQVWKRSRGWCEAGVPVGHWEGVVTYADAGQDGRLVSPAPAAGSTTESKGEAVLALSLVGNNLCGRLPRALLTFRGLKLLHLSDNAIGGGLAGAFPPATTGAGTRVALGCVVVRRASSRRIAFVCMRSLAP